MKKVGKFFVLIVISLLFNINYVYATSGCCSGHGGVDCSRVQANGKVVCNDGWTKSSCSYSSMAKCSGYSSSSSSKSTNATSYVYGCTNKNAKNYNSKATKDDGSCTYYVDGCMDATAKNYNSSADRDNGNCTYYIKGCTDSDAVNYDSSAEKDDGSCIKKVYGCMDKKATNYNSRANVNDNTCEYSQEINGTTSNKTQRKTLTDNTSNEPSDPVSVIIGLGIIIGFIY